ncbi:pro-resilin isoform X2 [Ooceraea biroi]|uniref:pro-resilin isoform X2 n=1 Tax=Ooceraea biroi TaxID=2015173 RepID=UPI0009716C97|nr:pro-resilin isoform X2 [Ooceraea biroi]
MFVILLSLSCAERIATRAGNLPFDGTKQRKYSFLLLEGIGIINMFKIGITMFITMLATARTELPVNSYLPAKREMSSASRGQDDLSTRYGAPNFDSASNFNRQSDNNAAGPSRLYGVPIGKNADETGQFGDGQPFSSYDTFSGGSNGIDGSSGYTSSATKENSLGRFNSNNNGEKLSSYGVPGTPNGNNKGGFGEEDNNKRPPSSYGVPERNGNTNYNGKNQFNDGNNGREPLTSYGLPNRVNTNGINAFGNINGELSSSYGPPNSDGNGENFRNNNTNGYLSASSNGNAENFKNGGNDGESYNDNAQKENNEPTKYEFSYSVKDERSGSNYGHMETREGDRIQGEFNVLLPDGRKQIVEYEADQDGFKPQIRYEGEVNTAGGYGSDAPFNNDVYSSSRRNNEASGSSANNSRFNTDSDNGGYPNADFGGRKTDRFSGGSRDEGNGYQSGKPGKQFFGRNKDGSLSGDIGEHFSNAPNNNIDGNSYADIGGWSKSLFVF